MKQPTRKTTDPDMIGAEAALRRAARRARLVARQTGTPIVIWRDGRVVEEYVTDDASTES
jgi:hypothetical protein